ncbi:MAG: RyR domain-containing protein [Pseudomonadota bacterium]
MTTPPDDEQLLVTARTVHAALSSWCEANGKDAYPLWSEAPEWMRTSTLESVAFQRDNPDASVSAQHDQWMEQKIGDGWRYGDSRDDDRRLHPMLVPYGDLPEFEQTKDAILKAIVDAIYRTNASAPLSART